MVENTMVVNLFGMPGAEKSTGAAYIFSRIKMMGVNAELITEFAKDKTWEENHEIFKNQAYIFGEQSFRMSRCRGKVDVIITDSPLPLSIVYNDDDSLTENFNLSVMDVFNSYNNINFLLNRVKPYNKYGRRQTESEADVVGKEIEKMMKDRNIDYTKVDGYIDGYETIVDIIMNKIGEGK